MAIDNDALFPFSERERLTETGILGAMRLIVSDLDLEAIVGVSEHEVAPLGCMEGILQPVASKLGSSSSDLGSGPMDSAEGQRTFVVAGGLWKHTLVPDAGYISWSRFNDAPESIVKGGITEPEALLVLRACLQSLQD